MAVKKNSASAAMISSQGEEDEILRPEHQPEDVELARRQVEQHRLPAVPVQPRQQVEHAEQRPHRQHAQAREAARRFRADRSSRCATYSGCPLAVHAESRTFSGHGGPGRASCQHSAAADAGRPARTRRSRARRPRRRVDPPRRADRRRAMRLRIEEGETHHRAERRGEKRAPDDGARCAAALAELVACCQRRGVFIGVARTGDGALLPPSDSTYAASSLTRVSPSRAACAGIAPLRPFSMLSRTAASEPPCSQTPSVRLGAPSAGLPLPSAPWQADAQLGELRAAGARRRRPRACGRCRLQHVAQHVFDAARAEHLAPRRHHAGAAVGDGRDHGVGIAAPQPVACRRGSGSPARRRHRSRGRWRSC